MAVETKSETPAPGQTKTHAFYELFGRTIESDLPLRQLPERPRAAPQIRILKSRPQIGGAGELLFQLPGPDGESVYSLSLRADAYTWTYDRVGTFEIARDGASIRWWAPRSAATDAAALLSGPILGFALQLRGLAGLHGDALVHGDAAFGLLAPSGYGKSTLAAALLRHGCSLLTDDMLALEMKDGKAEVLPGSERMKLWPDSLARFLPDQSWQPLASQVSWLDKRAFEPAPLGETAAESKPLSALFILCPGDETSALEAVPHRGQEALIGLVAHGYQSHLLAREPQVVKAQMDLCQALAATVPVYALYYPRSYDRLDDVTDLVLRTVVAGQSEAV